jgi:hypothetical protein
MTSSDVIIGLRGYQTLLDITTTPSQILEDPLPYGRHHILIGIPTSQSFIGGMVFDVIPGLIQVATITQNINMTSSMTYMIGLPSTYSDNLITFNFSTPDNINYSINVSSNISTVPGVLFKEFQVPSGYAGTNIYGCDTLSANNPATGAAISITSPIYQSYTGANALNFGQANVIQATDSSNDLTSSVTINSPAGTIVTASASLDASNSVNFIVYNTCVTTTSSIFISLSNYNGSGLPYLYTSNVTNGSFTVNIVNIGSLALNNTMNISFLCC